ncbi:MAG: hypothetical protein M1826_005396 [Phylliscum demangeonii]|nr:MAG: hypothetical protein M1826_005396 [Phylliscum demangeonii]
MADPHSAPASASSDLTDDTAMNELYDMFADTGMTQEEFHTMLKIAPPEELEWIVTADSPAIRSTLEVLHERPAQKALPTTKTLPPTLPPRQANLSELSPEPSLSAATNLDLLDFIHHHAFNKHPLAVHTVSERRRYTRHVYDYARAHGFASPEASAMVKEARRRYRKNRHLAKVAYWLYAAAEAGRDIEEEVATLREENDWDTDEMEGDFADGDEDATNFGSEIDDMKEALLHGPARAISALQNDTLPSDMDLSHIGGGMDGMAKLSMMDKTTSIGTKRKRTQRAIEISDDEHEVASELNDKPSRYESVAHSLNTPSMKSSHGGAQRSASQPTLPLTESSKTRRRRSQRKEAKQKDLRRGSNHTLGLEPSNIEAATVLTSGLAQHPTPDVLSLARPRKRREMDDSEGQPRSPYEAASISKLQALSSTSRAVAMHDGLRTEAKTFNRDSTNALSSDRKLIDSPAAVEKAKKKTHRGRGRRNGTRTGTDSKQDFEDPNETPPMPGVEGMGINYKTEAKFQSLAMPLRDFNIAPQRATQMVLEPNTPPSASQSLRSRKRPRSSPYFREIIETAAKLESSVPFPPLLSERFGLIQEALAHDPFQLLVAVTFLNRTRGAQAIPIFHHFISQYPTPEALAEADETALALQIRHLGLQNVRARRYVQLAKLWVQDPPRMGRRHRKLHYPRTGDGKDVKRGEVISDEDERAGAWEIAHLPTTGPYALDSWRIFCRDSLRGLSPDEKWEGMKFEPEWKRVIPLDKELRAYLRWKWLKEGWRWDPRNGHRVKASDEVLEKARLGLLAAKDLEEAEEDEAIGTSG